MDTVTLVFRKYRENGTPDNSERIIERDCDDTSAEILSHSGEMQSHGYELEAIMRPEDRT